MSIVLRIFGRIDGVATPVDEHYVVHYDPTMTGRSTDPAYTLQTTPDISKAKKFDTYAEALEYYRTISPNMPIRADGKPNRPLTVYTMCFETA